MRSGWIAALALCAGLAGAGDGVWPRFRSGIKAYRMGDFKAAQMRFESVVRSSPKFGDAYYYLGVLAEKRDDIRGAVNLFKAVEKKWPTYALSQERLGQIALLLKDYKAALHYFQNIVNVAPSADAWLQLSALQLDLEKYKEAEACLKACAKLTRGNLSLLELQARLYAETDRPKMAYDAYCKILKVIPRDASARYLRALCLLDMKRGAEAVDEMVAVLKMDPFHKGAIKHLLEAWAGDPSKERRVADLEKRLEQLRKHPPKVRTVSGK